MVGTNATILGCGYVGKVVAERWRSDGLRVTATTTQAERVPELAAVADQVAVLQGSDQPALQALLAETDLLLVTVGAKRGSSYQETYLNTAQALAAVLPQTPVRHLIYTSTYSVYGDHGGAWVTEATPVKPATENADIIAATERVLLDSARDTCPVCVFRLGGIYGPGRELARIFSRAAGTTRPGAGEEGSNWIHLDDIVAAIDFAREQRLSGLYNLVQDEVPTVRALIERVCDRNHLPPVTWDPSQPSSRPYNVRVSNQKLKAAGYTFIHSQFEEC